MKSDLIGRQAGLLGDAQDLAAETVVQAAHKAEVVCLGGPLDRLGDLAQGSCTDHARGTLQAMRGAGD